MSTERGYAAAATWGGKVVVVGGYDLDAEGALNSAEQYDPDSNRWTAFSSLLAGRFFHALVYASNTLFAIGGTECSCAMSSVERYNAVSGAWRQAPALNIARYGLAATTLRVCIIFHFYYLSKITCCVFKFSN
jgi:hypothetical protein